MWNPLGSLSGFHVVGGRAGGVLVPGNLHGKLVGGERAQEGGRRLEQVGGEMGPEVKLQRPEMQPLVERVPPAHTEQTHWAQEAADMPLLPSEVSHLFAFFF